MSEATTETMNTASMNPQGMNPQGANPQGANPEAANAGMDPYQAAEAWRTAYLGSQRQVKRLAIAAVSATALAFIFGVWGLMASSGPDDRGGRFPMGGERFGDRGDRFGGQDRMGPGFQGPGPQGPGMMVPDGRGQFDQDQNGGSDGFGGPSN